MPIDYSRLQARALDSSQDEEAVTVNTRALIDKVLARYSGEWTTLRELIQNAADANASKVSIKFETMPSSTVPLPPSTDQAAHMKHTILHSTLRRLLVTNNGVPFTENDWARLKRIAEGNPDETKIGAFGVGFYSVFSECDTPFITSGRESMAFYWKNNSLFTRKRQLPDDISNTDTCFMLENRDKTTQVPNLLSICRFLSTSLTFVGLESIELWLDNWNVFTLRKKSAPSMPVTIPGDVEIESSTRGMRITGVESQNSQIDASWINVVGWVPADADKNPISNMDSDAKSNQAPSLRTFFSRLTGSAQNAAAKKAAQEEEVAQQAIAEDFTGTSMATIFIRVNTVSVRTKLPKNFAAELERATKKPPPKQTKIAILTSSYDETQASMSTLSGAASKKVAELVTSILPNKNGRIFIGFPTSQTTGLLAHISAPSLLPTVERESIDLNAPIVKTWNQELLSIAGIACRISYIGEMNALKDHIKAHARSNDGQIGSDEVDAVIPAAVHCFNQFTSRDSTPLAKVGNMIQDAFWGCDKKYSIEMLSSRGILPSSDVRIASENLSFVKGIAIVPEKVMTQASEFLSKLQEASMIVQINTTDIKKELEGQTLNEFQLEEFLKWISTKTGQGNMEFAETKTLLHVAVASLSTEQNDGSSPQLLALRYVEHYINARIIPPDLPFPPSAIPFRFTHSLRVSDMRSLGWTEMTFVPWVRWLVDGAVNKTLKPQRNLTNDSAFSQQILATISRSWENISESSKNTIIGLLSPLTVIPTKLGMRKPTDAYFESVRLFDDLPTSTLHNVKEKFLKALGVRKTVELSVIFERLMKGPDTDAQGRSRGWSHIELIKYLVSVWSDIPQQDIALLKKTAICPAQKGEDPTKPTAQRFKMGELFEPKESLKGLGLNMLQWPGHYNSYSSEGKFMKLLGLRQYPSAPELVNIMAMAHTNMDKTLYETALRYFIDQHSANNYQAFDLSDVQTAFLPVQGSEKQRVFKASECFTESKADILGYHILRSDLHVHAEKLGVKQNPPISDCAIKLIRKPPKDHKEAISLFGYFATRLQDIPPAVSETLGKAAIVPIGNNKSKKDPSHDHWRLTTPVNCFLGDGEEFGDIFDYVNFGRDPNMFLLKVGSKHEPSTAELTRLLLREPVRIFQTLGVEKYLNLLRKIHVNMNALNRDKDLWSKMKQTAFLVAYTERPIDKAKDSKLISLDGEEDDMEPIIKEWTLLSARQIVIIDEILLHSIFKNHVIAAPQDETLEELYAALGTPSISSVVVTEPKIGPARKDQRVADHLRKIVIERVRLFLHEQPRSTILHDVKWLEKNLDFQQVQSLSLRRSLRAQTASYSERRTAIFAKNHETRRPTVFITEDYDMWQVSEVIASLMIDRAKTQTSMVLEMFLTTSLHKLRSRGYNVDRILKKKAQEEAKVVELEKQRREEEERNLMIKAEQEASRQPRSPHSNTNAGQLVSVAADTEPKSKQNGTADLMPGSFHDSPEQQKQILDNNAVEPPKSSRSKGLFSGLSKKLGFDDQSTSSKHMQNFLPRADTSTQQGSQQEGSRNSKDHPPPYSPTDPNSSSGSKGKDVRRQKSAEHVTNQSSVLQNLRSAVSASRPHDSSQLFTRPQTNAVKETPTYCDSHKAHDLKCIGGAGRLPSFQVSVFLSPDSLPSSVAASAAQFLELNKDTLTAFAEVLLICADIYNLPRTSVHIFHDASGPTIAFNSGGAIFANYRYFLQLHSEAFAPGAVSRDHPSADEMSPSQRRMFALNYWWVVLAHELAHNLVSDHSSDHSFYTEQFIVEYFFQCVFAGSRLESGGS
ncbi:MAG: hypothetical protein M1831_005527 [Alyxoria varia]|nr:MAG: hypothetical protein M1831_005527 [Alyxoria varia]